MRIRFTLSMDNLEVNDKHIDQLTFSWIQELSSEQVLALSSKWVSDKDFLTHQMPDLKKVGESSLTIEPIEEEVTS